MTQLGMGAMLHYLGGGSDYNPEEFVGKTIIKAKLNEEDDRVEITFDNNETIHIWDNGQSCCEYRYITCDDDWSNIIGGKLLAIETKEGPEIEKDYEYHESVFIDIKTDKGFVTFTTHNEHNGYYGGFGLTITKEQS